jgi:hypothetical protein
MSFELCVKTKRKVWKKLGIARRWCGRVRAMRVRGKARACDEKKRKCKEYQIREKGKI